MLQDPAHLFRRMWAAEGWASMVGPGASPACWSVQRDGQQAQSPSQYFDDVLSGQWCSSNWYAGTADSGALGQRGDSEDFAGFELFAEMFAGFELYPALLGYDEAIDEMCKQGLGGAGYGGGHAQACVHSGLNILSLFSDEVPYNTCRNFEWQVCAARGELPGQRAPSLVFGTAPGTLDPHGGRLGTCSGWLPENMHGRPYGYANDDIFFLESCLYSQVCTNGDEMFALGVGEHWTCQFSEGAFRELQHLLLAPPLHQPTDASGCTTRALCKDWCNRFTCDQSQCAACGADRGCSGQNPG